MAKRRTPRGRDKRPHRGEAHATAKTNPDHTRPKTIDASGQPCEFCEACAGPCPLHEPW